MSDLTNAPAGAADRAATRNKWVLAIELAIGCAIYGSVAGFVFNRLLHWVDTDISRMAFWSVLLFIVIGIGIQMAGKGDPATMPAGEHERLRRAATTRATNLGVVVVTVLLTIWAYGVHRQWF